MKVGKAPLWACASLVGLLLPIGVRWGIPKLAGQVQASGLLSPPTTQATTVTAIHGNTWQINSPQQPPRIIHLAGLKPIAAPWQNQANSVAIMLIKSFQNQVDIKLLNPNSSLAIVHLPNGTVLQEILLKQGLAQFDPNQKGLPPGIAHTLQQAQQSAQRQYKNIWGSP